MRRFSRQTDTPSKLDRSSLAVKDRGIYKIGILDWTWQQLRNPKNLLVISRLSESRKFALSSLS